MLGILASIIDGVLVGFHHAWITLDGEHAVDPTWSKPAVKYFGIAVSLKQLWQVMSRTRCYGSVIENLDCARLTVIDGGAP